MVAVISWSMDSTETNDVCERCGGDGYIEIMGDGENFECDVIDTKPCPECSRDWDD